MLTVAELDAFLHQEGADYALIRQDEPLRSSEDAAKYFDMTHSAPVLIVQTERGFFALLAAGRYGRVDFPSLKQRLGFAKLKLAAPRQAEEITGCRVGEMPLVGLDLPCIFDERLLAMDFVYGGTGDAYYTLKIAPQDVKRLNRVAYTFD